MRKDYNVVGSSLDTKSYVTFKLGDELFAIDVFQVREIIDLTRIARVPNAPESLRGVVNVRGKAIPVLDLRRAFGLAEGEPSVNTRILVLELEFDGERCVVGGLADSVHDVIELAPEQIESAPQLAARWRSRLVNGLARRDADFVMLLDVDAIFAADELAAIVRPGPSGAPADAA
jgi:purine-binding chemotaxis protein CheW